MQYLHENVKDEVDSLPAEKHQRFLQIDFIILGAYVTRPIQITRNKMLAISWQCLKKDVSDKFNFCMQIDIKVSHKLILSLLMNMIRILKVLEMTSFQYFLPIDIYIYRYKTFQKSSHLEGYKISIFLLERGNKAEKGWGGGGGGGSLFFITLQFNHIYCVCVGKARFLLLLFGSSVFLVSRARFSSSKWTIFFESQGKMFLSIEKVLEKISEEQP